MAISMKTFDKRKRSKEYLEQKELFEKVLRSSLEEVKDKLLALFSVEAEKIAKDKAKDWMLELDISQAVKEAKIKEIGKEYIIKSREIQTIFSEYEQSISKMYEKLINNFVSLFNINKVFQLPDGILSLTESAEKKTHNPKTMEEIIIPKRPKVKFIFEPRVLEAIDEASSQKLS